MFGRRTKLDDLVSKRIVDAIAAGGSRSAAAEAAGIHRSTLFDWLARGRDGEQPYSDFADRCKKAEGDAENEMVAVVRKAAASGTWQAAAWWLERRRPRLYANTGRRELKELVKGFLDASASSARPEDQLALVESVAAALRSRVSTGAKA